MWRKSTYSHISGDCVEVGLTATGEVVVRDSKSPHAAKLTFTAAEWDAFLAGVASGQFSREALASPGAPRGG
ncbi:DUF397 domain-containing protein [Thermoactinospora rubra]|uniref:DUF397 domain-containing protein n=1 Tax=Thermoactinospora rubra TaxID=1088767 RepID=UPI000A10D418|nr:DUF397 domain-containing protein [Thermoactinospora rubra]